MPDNALRRTTAPLDSRTVRENWLATLAAVRSFPAAVAWLVVGLGALAAFSMAAFFTLQSLFIWAEDRLQVDTWPAPAAHAWTLTFLLGLSPLIVIPLLGTFCL